MFQKSTTTLKNTGDTPICSETENTQNTWSTTCPALKNIHQFFMMKKAKRRKLKTNSKSRLSM
jgi:hypothetical protein